MQEIMIEKTVALILTTVIPASVHLAEVEEAKA